MKHTYSLVHLTNINCPPPEMIRIAAKAGYDAVSLRTIPMGLPGERPYDIAKDPKLLRDTREAAKETGIWLHDTGECADRRRGGCAGLRASVGSRRRIGDPAHSHQHMDTGPNVLYGAVLLSV